MAWQSSLCGPTPMGCIDPDEIRDYFISFQSYPAGVILVAIQWLVDGPFIVDPSTPASPQGLTVVDDYTGETFTLCERVRLRCDLTDDEKRAAIGSKQKTTLRFIASDGQSLDRGFVLDVVAR